MVLEIDEEQSSGEAKMLARVYRSGSSSSPAVSAARLFCTRSIRHALAKKSRDGESGFGGESLKLRSGFHEIKGLEDAIDLFGDMVRSRPLPSVIDFCKLMGVVVRMGRLDVVISLHRKMEMRRVPCNAYSFTILMKCFCSCSKLPFALSTFGKITKLGFHPTVVTFSTLLHGLCVEDRISEALDLFHQMCKPNVVTFTTLMNGLCREGRVVEAVALLDRMLEDGLQPNQITYGTIVDGMCKMGDTVSALNLLRKMEEVSHIKPNVVIWPLERRTSYRCSKSFQ
ncbi:hypothetical protein EYS10_02600 (plasmid) [Rahnella aquatilis]|nr:hypothetical protein EYS10_02600 [Rahnella aquatilis]